MRQPKLQLDLSPKLGTHLNVMHTQEMQQALRVLQMSHLELMDWLSLTVLENPTLEWGDDSSPYMQSSSQIGEFEIKDCLSLQEILLEQVREQIPDDIEIAKAVISELDDKGFFCPPIKEWSKQNHFPYDDVDRVLSTMKTFDPSGICAKNVQECLSIQLKKRGWLKGLEIIRDHYDLFIHKRYGLLSKMLGIPRLEIEEIIQKELVPLTPFPGLEYKEEIISYVVPEMIFERDEDKWEITFPSKEIEVIHLPRPQKMGKQEGQLWQKFHKEALWTLNIYAHRQEILEQLAKVFITEQERYLAGEERAPSPMTMKKLAEHLQVAESTISRAVQDKWIQTPIGMIAMKSLFSNAISSQQKETSKEQAKVVLAQLIQGEDPVKPRPDQLLAELMEQKGITLSRRTVAKYRSELDIPAHHLRSGR